MSWIYCIGSFPANDKVGVGFCTDRAPFLKEIMWCLLFGPRNLEIRFLARLEFGQLVNGVCFIQVVIYIYWIVKLVSHYHHKHHRYEHKHPHHHPAITHSCQVFSSISHAAWSPSCLCFHSFLPRRTLSDRRWRRQLVFCLRSSWPCIAWMNIESLRISTRRGSMRMCQVDVDDTY